MTLMPMPDGSNPDLGIPPGGYQYSGIPFMPGQPTYSPAPQPTLGNPTPQSTGNFDPNSEFMQAVQELGIDPHTFRSNPAVMDRVTAYLNQKYPGQNWTNGGTRAGDWMGYGGQGQGIDVLPAGDANWQTLADSANSTEGTGGGMTLGGAGSPFTGDPSQMIEQTPGYGFLRDQAVKSFDRSAAAHGTLLSGGYPQALSRYITSMVAGPAYDREMGYLSQLSALGFNAANQTGGFGGTFAANAGTILGQQGNSAANATVGAANAGANATNSVINSLGQVQWPWNKPKAPAPPVTNSSYTPGQSGPNAPDSQGQYPD